MHRLTGPVLAGVCGVAVMAGFAPSIHAKDILVADRLTNSVYRYSEAGSFLGKVLTDSVNLNEPTGLALSPDLTKLYVSSAQNSRLVRYDYDYATGTATGGTIVAEGASDGLAFPNAILFSRDGTKLYVSNLNGTGVAQFFPDGSNAGPNINGVVGGGSIFQFSGLAFAPSGELLVGGFQDFPAGSSGAVAKSNAAITTLGDFIGPGPSLVGASGLLVRGSDLYVTGMFAGNIQKFNVTTGAVDPSFGVGGLAFPQGLVLSPDGNGFLAGILGFTDGDGHIAHYDFDGNLVGDGVFADHGGGGFTEATAFIVEPLLPGDFDGDREVDAADLAIWRANFGNNSGSATVAMGDATGDGRVDGADLFIWQRWLRPSDAIPAGAVPEPGAAMLIVVGAACFASFRRCVAPRLEG